MWKCESVYTVVPNCPVANCSLSIFSEPKCSIENGGDAFPLRVFSPWDSASEKDINYVLTHRRSWSVSWGQSQSGKGSPQHSRSALSRGNTWKFPLDSIQFGGSTGTSSLAWEDKPSSGRRWSTPSDHTPTGTSSFLAEKKFHIQGEKQPPPGTPRNPWKTFNCFTMQCQGCLYCSNKPISFGWIIVLVLSS